MIGSHSCAVCCTPFIDCRHLCPSCFVKWDNRCPICSRWDSIKIPFREFRYRTQVENCCTFSQSTPVRSSPPTSASDEPEIIAASEAASEDVNAVLKTSLAAFHAWVRQQMAAHIALQDLADGCNLFTVLCFFHFSPSSVSVLRRRAAIANLQELILSRGDILSYYEQQSPNLDTRSQETRTTDEVADGEKKEREENEEKKDEEKKDEENKDEENKDEENKDEEKKVEEREQEKKVDDLSIEIETLNRFFAARLPLQKLAILTRGAAEISNRHKATPLSPEEMAEQLLQALSVIDSRQGAGLYAHVLYCRDFLLHFQLHSWPILLSHENSVFNLLLTILQKLSSVRVVPP